MKEASAIREIHDLTGTVARHYIEKYGDQAVSTLEFAARAFEENDDIHGRNKMLRLRDEVIFLSPSLTAE
ncbi:hypothetical protein NBZ79_15665 [Sneathiella marina]|uniref:Uncharacterized protein n=1 Tax=Sneathiella marina TaxID=2950108 RepID=A0ABY4W0I8_9PROT|nr:hypothetical protein [Sneathiella marina]USG60603.1 hypothetical protein NBZ79_15665 [Sneathiella marina]